jgi:hypothetical protein
MQFEINDARVKNLAWSMKNYLGDKGHDVPNTAILEALAQGLGFSDYRTLKAMSAEEPAASEEVSTYLQEAQALLKGDKEVAVYFGTYYSSMLMAPQYPDWCKLKLSPALLARILELRDKAAAERIAVFTLDEGFSMDWESRNKYRISSEELHVDSSAVWGKMQLRHEDGDVSTRPWYYDSMRTALESRSVGEPVFVEVSDEVEVQTSDPASPRFAGQEQYLIAEDWGHTFVGSTETMVSFVFDTTVHRITYMMVKGQLASRAEIADVENSLLNANSEALDDPEEWGLEASDELPDWATGEPAYKSQPSVREAVSQSRGTPPVGDDFKVLRKRLEERGYDISDVADWVFHTYHMDLEAFVDEQVDSWIKQFLDLKG